MLDAGANAADYLYSVADQGNVSLTIIGDPAWIQQGEVWSGIAGLDFDYGPFLPDGTINYESQEALFEILFNKPVDYDLETGLMDPGQQNYQANRAQGRPGEAAQTYTYRLKSIVNNFSNGKFTQDLSGTIVEFPSETPANADAGRPSPDTPSNTYFGPDQSDAETRRLQAGAEQARFGGKTWADRQQRAAITMREARAGRAFQGTRTVDAEPLAADSLAAEGFTQPANPAEPPTSSGQPVGTSNSLFGSYGASGINAGIPIVTYTTSTGRVITASSAADLQTAFNQGFINKVVQNELTRRLNQLQQQANNASDAGASQQIRRDP